jgi:hypothetical protein
MSKIRKTFIAGFVVVACGVSALAGTAFAAGQFNDVNENHPFFDDIEWMADTGISTGYQDGTYRPGDPVTRQAMSAFLHRANTYEIVVASQAVQNQSTGSAVAFCPAGTSVVSGGASHNGNNITISGSFPSADGSSWTATFEVDDNANQSFTARSHAVCGPVTTELG